MYYIFINNFKGYQPIFLKTWQKYRICYFSCVRGDLESKFCPEVVSVAAARQITVRARECLSQWLKERVLSFSEGIPLGDLPSLFWALFVAMTKSVKEIRRGNTKLGS